MKQLAIVLLVGVLALGYAFRAKLMPYAPAWVVAYVEPAPQSAAAEGAGKPEAKAGRRGGSSSGPTAVTVAVAKAGSLPVTRTTIGTVVPVNVTALSSEVSGTVAAVLVKDGATVAKGDLLARLDDRTIRAALAKDAAQISKDRATVIDAQMSYDRAAALVNRGAGTVQASDDAQTALRVAQGTLAVDQAAEGADKVALSLTEVRAPFDGRLGAVLLSQGAYVSPGTTLVKITQMKPVLAQFSLAETDLALLRQAQAAGVLKATVTPVLQPGSMGGKTGAAGISGPVEFIDSAVDAASATITLRANLANEDGALWPGQTINVTLDAGTTPELVLVPSVAVAPHSDGSTVFVVKDDNTVELRKVTVALRQGDLAGLSAGVTAGEKVVTEGQATLLQGAPVKVITKAEAGASAPPAPGKPAKPGQAEASDSVAPVATKS